MQPAPDPPPAPQIHIDFGAMVDGIVNGFKAILSDWANQLPGQIATNGTDVVHQATSWMNVQGINFILHTPVALVTVGASVITPADLRGFLSDLASLAIILAGISYVGQYMFGWPGLGETTSRIAVTIILVSASYKLADLILGTLNGVTEHIIARVPGMPDLANVNPIVILGAVICAFVLSFRLALQMGKRLIWLGTLYPLLPLATASLIHSKSAWIGSTIWRLFIGWMLGQLLVVMCFLVAIAMLATVGGPAGLILSLASLLVAYDAVYILAPKDGGFAISVGVGPARMSL